MSEEIKKEAAVEKESKKSGRVEGIWCSFCNENRAGYTKNGKLICSACLNTKARTADEFFSFNLSDLTSNIQVKGFHPSPLPSNLTI